MAQGIAQKEDFLRLADAALEIIIGYGEDGRICYGNRLAKEESGYGEGLLDCSVQELFPVELSWQDGKEEGRAKEADAGFEGMMYRKNGTCFPVWISVLEGGQIQYLFAVNIAKQVELERKLVRTKEEMEDTIKVKNEFVANVTHELRTPVNGIRGHVKNLLDAGVSEEQGRTLDIVLRCCGNMSAIINNILDFSKLEAGKFTVEQKEFDFYEMVNHAVETNIAAIEEKGLRAIVNVDRQIPEYLIGDELRLTQVLNNLLSNAVKFTSIGYVSIEVTKTLEFDDEVELFFVVSDTGIGISKDETDKLFKSFSQVDASITRKYGGTGLGLSITKQLVELMHGSIHVESEKGKGSSFSFSARLHVAQDKSAAGQGNQKFEFLNQEQPADGMEDMEQIFRFGSKENLQEIKSKMEKLIICIEVGAWDKAEMFTHNVKALAEQGPKEIKKAAFRLEMAVRKEDMEKSVEQYGRLKETLEGAVGGL